MAAPRIAPWPVAAVLALAWMAFGPATPDLAAQVYRADLFQRAGWTIFDLYWYGGHHMPAYSILFPPLGALLGVRTVGVLAAVASALLFERIARRQFGASAARWGALWFGIGTAADLLIGRLTFALGVAFALGAVLALQRGRRRLGYALGALCSLASPVAGLFLALAGVAHWLARYGRARASIRRVTTRATSLPDPRATGTAEAASTCVPERASTTRRRDAKHARAGIWLATAAFTPAAALAILFPEGGSQPFALGAFAAIVLCCALLLWLLPTDQRVLRAGVLLYLGSTALAFVVASPMGGNASRLGVAFAGPLLLCAALPACAGKPERRRLVLAAAIPLAIWQWWAPVRETFKGAVDPSASLAYFRPLLTFLQDRADAAPVRVEVPFTRLHWESVHVARTTSLARGWETQLDVKYNALFRAGAEPKLTATRYRVWLEREGVHYVALPDVALDPTGSAEAKLIRQGLPFLRPVFRDRHWEVFAVRNTPGLTSGVARLTTLGPESFTLRAKRAGSTLVRVRYTPYWRIARGSGCVSRATRGWTLVTSPRAGPVTVDASFDPRRLVEVDSSCSHTGSRL
jgi:hypothetical protein